MNSKDNWGKRAEFRTLRREELIPFLVINKFLLTFNNNSQEVFSINIAIYENVSEADESCERSSTEIFKLKRLPTMAASAKPWKREEMNYSPANELYLC